MTARPGRASTADLAAVSNALSDYAAAVSAGDGQVAVTMCVENAAGPDLAFTEALREVRDAGLTGEMVRAEVMTGAELKRRMAAPPFPEPRREVS